MSCCPMITACDACRTFLQQLTMESNGKQVSTDGRRLDYTTGPILWGSAGTMGQHSFHQLLHQGQHAVPSGLCPAPDHPYRQPTTTPQPGCQLPRPESRPDGGALPGSRQSKLLLQRGLDDKKAAQLAPHLVMPGNRPSSIITMESLSPGTLGALLALYEHRTFCSGQLWRINSFDQWGVELGKEISCGYPGTTDRRRQQR